MYLVAKCKRDNRPLIYRADSDEVTNVKSSRVVVPLVMSASCKASKEEKDDYDGAELKPKRLY